MNRRRKEEVQMQINFDNVKITASGRKNGADSFTTCEAIIARGHLVLAIVRRDGSIQKRGTGE